MTMGSKGNAPGPAGSVLLGGMARPSVAHTSACEKSKFFASATRTNSPMTASKKDCTALVRCSDVYPPLKKARVKRAQASIDRWRALAAHKEREAERGLKNMLGGALAAWGSNYMMARIVEERAESDKYHDVLAGFGMALVAKWLRDGHLDEIRRDTDTDNNLPDDGI